MVLQELASVLRPLGSRQRASVLRLLNACRRHFIPRYRHSAPLFPALVIVISLATAVWPMMAWHMHV